MPQAAMRIINDVADEDLKTIQPGLDSAGLEQVSVVSAFEQKLCISLDDVEAQVVPRRIRGVCHDAHFEIVRELDHRLCAIEYEDGREEWRAARVPRHVEFAEQLSERVVLMLVAFQ